MPFSRPPPPFFPLNSDYFITKGTVTPKSTLQTSAKVEAFAVLAFKPKGAGAGSRSSKRNKRKPNDFTTVSNILAGECPSCCVQLKI